MDKQKNDKKVLIIILIVLVLILIGIGIYLILAMNTKEKDNKSEVINTYNIVKGNEYKVFTYIDNKYELFTTVSLDYPQINSKDDNIINLNNQIKNIFEKAKSLYESKYKISSDHFCKFCYLKDSEYYCNDEIVDTNYLLKEDDNYLLIRINDFESMACSSGFNDVKYYTYDKKSKKILDNKDIIKKLKFDSNDIINKLKSFIKNNHQSTESIDIDETIKSLNTSQYFINNSNLYIVYKVEDAISYNEIVMYDGTNFKIISEDEIVKIFD